LQREGIVRTALTLMNEIGLDALTLRRLAQELEVQAPALYWHFKNKQELLNEMAEMMLFSATLPPDLHTLEWSESLRLMGVSLRRTLLSYQDGARLLASAETSKESLHTLDLILGILVRAGLDYKQALIGTFTMTNYVLGFTFEEQASSHSSVDAKTYLRDLMMGQSLPYLSAAFDQIAIPFDSNDEFEASLGLIIDSLKLRLAQIKN
jgi:TetR/AcrR family transcriptional regulator, tetracycline repressor protein